MNDFNKVLLENARQDLKQYDGEATMEFEQIEDKYIQLDIISDSDFYITKAIQRSAKAYFGDNHKVYTLSIDEGDGVFEYYLIYNSDTQELVYTIRHEFSDKELTVEDFRNLAQDNYDEVYTPDDINTIEDFKISLKETIGWRTKYLEDICSIVGSIQDYYSLHKDVFISKNITFDNDNNKIQNLSVALIDKDTFKVIKEFNFHYKELPKLARESKSYPRKRDIIANVQEGANKTEDTFVC